MKELEEMLRLRKSGVRFDYYMTDAFCFDRPVAMAHGVSRTGLVAPRHGLISAVKMAFRF
jgi:hypothetical protein